MHLPLRELLTIHVSFKGCFVTIQNVLFSSRLKSIVVGNSRIYLLVYREHFDIRTYVHTYDVVSMPLITENLSCKT